VLRYFPNLYEDELLYSAIARYHRHVANAGYKTTLFELFGSKSVCACVDLPSHLYSLAGRIRPNDPDCAASLLINHTLYPYYARFLAPKVATAFKNKMFGNNGSLIQTHVGVVAFEIRPPLHLKVCSECVEMEKVKWGEIYWHRVHQLPGVFVCPTHGCWLCNTDVRYHPHGKHDFVDASEVTIFGSPALNEHYKPDLLAVAKMSRAFLVDPLNPVEYEELGKHYREMARVKGFARGNFIDQKKFEEAFRERFDMLLPSFVSRTKRNYDRLRSLVRKHRNAHHPLWHILFRLFIDERNDVSLPQARRSPNTETLDAKELRKRRQQWLSAISISPDAGTAILRARFPALYTWLNRHDARWLRKHSPLQVRQPSKSTVDWAKRDKLFCDQLVERVAANPEELPVWRTRSKLLLLLDRPSTVAKNRKKLPCTWQMLEELSETRVEFQKRRVEWSAKQLSNGETPQGWQIIRRARLREPLHPDVQRKVEELVGARNNFT